jgi:hypothetical protein
MAIAGTAMLDSVECFDQEFINQTDCSVGVASALITLATGIMAAAVSVLPCHRVDRRAVIATMVLLPFFAALNLLAAIIIIAGKDYSTRSPKWFFIFPGCMALINISLVTLMGKWMENYFPKPGHPKFVPKTAGSDEEQGGKTPTKPHTPALDSVLGSGTSGSGAPTLPSMLPFTLTVNNSQAGLPRQAQAR